MALEVEKHTYQEHLAELQGQIGKYVLIQSDQIVDVYAAYEDALKAGYERFGLGGFMVRRIETPETVHSFTRDIDPCHT